MDKKEDKQLTVERRLVDVQDQVKHIHPALAPLLEESYGVILYQEQVLRIANEIAGFELAEADLLRRAMSHFDPGRHMQELKRKFIEQALERNAIPADVAERIWEMMALTIIWA